MTSHSEPKGAPILQVLIVAYGREGIDSVASLAHPEVEGVEYLVSWQTADCLELTVAAPEEIQAAIPAALREREDFRIFPSDTSGVSLNRNLVLDRASAPLAICSDDDVAYLPEDLHNIIETFNRHPEADFIAFEYRSDTPKRYPSESFDLARPPKGYYIGGPEMAFRLERIRRHGIRFNEWFGIGCEFPAGEEDLFLADCLDAGLKCIFLPVAVCRHDGDSTGEREHLSPTFIRTKGAILGRLHPATWPLRMILHALRSPTPHSLKASLAYCRYWLRGVADSRRLKVFAPRISVDTPRDMPLHSKNS